VGINIKMNLIFYSHKDYSDIWPILFGQTDKYFNDSHRKILFTNDGNVPKGWEKILYDDSLRYQERFIYCLEKLDCENVIYHHEDMFLYKKPNLDYISKLYDLLDKYDFIKLIKTGINLGINVDKNLYEFQNTPQDYFAIQPSIWKVKKLLEVYKNTIANTIWEFEGRAGQYCLDSNIKGVFCYNKDKDMPRGGHFDSSVYPYIATAVVKGKWNFKEYRTELEEIFNEYSFEPTREIL